jgi:hypothetical protein
VIGGGEAVTFATARVPQRFQYMVKAALALEIRRMGVVIVAVRDGVIDVAGQGRLVAVGEAAGQIPVAHIVGRQAPSMACSRVRVRVRVTVPNPPTH